MVKKDVEQVIFAGLMAIMMNAYITILTPQEREVCVILVMAFIIIGITRLYLCLDVYRMSISKLNKGYRDNSKLVYKVKHGWSHNKIYVKEDPATTKKWVNPWLELDYNLCGINEYAITTSLVTEFAEKYPTVVELVKSMSSREISCDSFSKDRFREEEAMNTAIAAIIMGFTIWVILYALIYLI